MHAENFETPLAASSGQKTLPLNTPSLQASASRGGYSFVMYVLDLAAIIAAVLLDDLIYRSVYSATSQVTLPFVSALLIGWTALSLYAGVYSGGPALRFGHHIRRSSSTMLLLMLCTLGALYLAELAVPRPFVLILFALAWSMVTSWRMLARAFTSMRRTQSNAHKAVLIVGASELGLQVADMLKQTWPGTNIVGFVDDEKRGHWGQYDVLGNLESIAQTIEQNKVSEVIVTLPNSAYEKINHTVLTLKDQQINVSLVPDYLSLALYRPTVSTLGNFALISLTEPALTISQRVIKRMFDISVALMGLMVASPFMLVIAIAIKLDSEGPILFKQDRIGEGGKLFKMYKFRSMVSNAEALQAQVNVVDENGNTIHKRRNDPRVTRVGKFIRKTSLDEIPQLLNVLNGSMSVVGPRPELPWMVNEHYQAWQYRRFAVPQGITGWWQVTGRADRPMHLNTEQDLFYIQNYSFWLDMRIILKTVPALVKGKGAF